MALLDLPETVLEDLCSRYLALSDLATLLRVSSKMRDFITGSEKIW